MKDIEFLKDLSKKGVSISVYNDGDLMDDKNGKRVAEHRFKLEKSKEKEWMNKIGEQVRQLRESIGITQAELSERSGLDRTNISKIEGGRYNVSVGLLGRIAESLGCCDIELKRLD